MSSTRLGIRHGLSFILSAALFPAVIDFAVSPPSAVAQTLYKSDPIGAKFLPPDESAYDKTDRQQRMDYLQKSADYKRMRGEVDRLIRDALRGTVDFNANRAGVDEYFQQLALPEMTQADPRSLAQLGARRDGVMGALRDAPNGSPVRQYLVDQLLLPFAARVGMDAGYHSAVRLNAVLIAGLLNDREGIRNVEPPAPSNNGLQFLLQILADSATPAYLQIGALSGILRHAQIDGQLSSKRMSAAQVQAITDFSLATLQKTAEGAAGDELYWMKRQSAQILGALRQPGSDGRVAAALRQMIQNADTPLWLGLDAVDAYGRLQFPDPAQADATATVQAVGAALSRWLAHERGEIDQYLISIKENKLLAERSKPEARRAAGEEQGGVDEGIGAGGGIGGAAEARRPRRRVSSTRSPSPTTASTMRGRKSKPSSMSRGPRWMARPHAAAERPSPRKTSKPWPTRQRRASSINSPRSATK